jgi:TolB protein
MVRPGHILAMSMLLGIGCSDSISPDQFTLEKVAANNGDEQRDTVLASVAPLRVVVRRNGAPAGGVTVRWSMLGAPTKKSSTGSDGVATLALQLGSTAGPLSVQAIIDGNASVPPVSFSETVLPGHVAGLRLASGAVQADTVNAVLGVDYAVRAVDSYDNGIGGVTIDWAVTAGGGTITPPRSTTDTVNGTATARHTLGPRAGMDTVTATAGGIAGSVFIQALVGAGHPTQLALVSGNDQLGPSTRALDSDFVVRVTDRNWNGVSGAAVAWTVTAGGGTLSAATTMSGTAGTASVRLTLGPGNDPQTVAAVVSGAPGVSSVVFTAHPASATVTATIKTSGEDPDADGYSLSATRNGNAAGAMVVSVPANGTVQLPNLSAGNYTLSLSGVAVNCDVVEPSAPTAVLASNGSATVAFNVACSAAPDLALEIAVGNQGSDIYRMKLNGDGLTRIVIRGGAPKWSPDGSRIVYTSYSTTRSEIFVINADGSGAKRISSVDGYAADATWSPDGGKIAFTNYNAAGGNSSELFVVNADGSGQTRLTVGRRDFLPAWSPDGRRIAFTGYDGTKNNIWVMNADGTGLIPLSSGGAFGTAWSPDGRKIAFVGSPPASNDVYVMNSDGSGATLIGHDAESPAWSPDGTRLVFVHVDCDYYYVNCSSKVSVTNADGSSLKQFTFDGTMWQPSWSRDGRWIAFGGPTRVMHPDGTRLTDLGVAASLLSWR